MPQEVDHKTIPFLRQKRREILSIHTVRNANTDAQLSQLNTQENTSPVQVFNETNQRNEPTRKKETEILTPRTFCVGKAAAKEARNPSSARNANTDAQLSQLNTQENTSPVQVFNETNQRNEPTKRTNEKKRDRILTPRTFCVGKAAAKTLYPRNPNEAKRNAHQLFFSAT